mgnify:CR=1 FL=1
MRFKPPYLRILYGITSDILLIEQIDALKLLLLPPESDSIITNGFSFSPSVSIDRLIFDQAGRRNLYSQKYEGDLFSNLVRVIQIDLDKFVGFDPRVDDFWNDTYYVPDFIKSEIRNLRIEMIGIKPTFLSRCI